MNDLSAHEEILACPSQTTASDTCTAVQFADFHRDENWLKQRRRPLRIMDVGIFKESWECQPGVKFAESSPGREC
jgi:hypothetical protein